MKGASGMPGFWMHETTGKLRPAVERYIHRRTLPEDIPILRAYLRQWVWADLFIGDEIVELRRTVDAITDMDSLDAWITRAVHAGCDPL